MTKTEIIDRLEHLIDVELKSVYPMELKAQLKEKLILVYGAGSGGRYTKFLLSKINITVSGFLDINAEKIKEVDGIKVLSPTDNSISDFHKNNSLVIVSVGNLNTQREIAQKLKEYGYTKSIGYIELFNEVFVMADDQLASCVGFEYYQSNKKNIIKCSEIFEDEISRNIYLNYIKGHAMHNNAFFEQPQELEKYFPKDIKFKKGYSNFVDCGSFNGETLNKLKKNGIKPNIITMFEPDRFNLDLLRGVLNNNKNCFADQLFLWPCAVWSKTEFVNFVQSGTVGSTIFGCSKDEVQGIRLDDAIINFKPTFIKMDIEGAEYDAITGAKDIICKNKPDLAICVYHFVNHIWDIPLLINSWNLGYKFYLRAHNVFGMATILYAVSE